MTPKKIILCPNPNRDRGMLTTKAADRILQEMGDVYKRQRTACWH